MGGSKQQQPRFVSKNIFHHEYVIIFDANTKEQSKNMKSQPMVICKKKIGAFTFFPELGYNTIVELCVFDHGGDFYGNISQSRKQWL